MFLVRLLLILWSLISFSAVLGHVFQGELLASWSTWGYASGWQREIAIFDSVLIIFIVQALRSGDEKLQNYLLKFLVLLGFLLGTNHFSGYFHNREWLHIIFALLNYCFAAVGIVALKAPKKNF